MMSLAPTIHRLDRMNRFFKVIWPMLAGVACCGSALKAEGENPEARMLPLPRWMGEVPRPNGSDLWPEDFMPSEIAHPPSPDEEAAAAREESDSWMRFLPSSLFKGKNKRQPPSKVPIENVSDEVLRAAEHVPETVHLLDPQSLLGEAQTEDITRLLASHTGDAAVDLFVLVLDRYQQVPSDADLTRLASGAVARGANCLAVVPLGAPDRARLFFTQSVMEKVPASYLSTLAAGCARDAAETTEPMGQLERYAMQLCVQLFWLERAYPAIKPPPVEIRPAIVEQQPLQEVATEAAPQVKESKFQTLWQKYSRVVLGGAVGLVALLIAAVLFIRWNRRRSRQSVWLLPEFDHKHPVRFSGPHCGGCGAKMNYG